MNYCRVSCGGGRLAGGHESYFLVARAEFLAREMEDLVVWRYKCNVMCRRKRRNKQRTILAKFVM